MSVQSPIPFFHWVRMPTVETRQQSYGHHQGKHFSTQTTQTKGDQQMSVLKKLLSATLAVLVALVFSFSFPALTDAAHASEIHAYTQESSGQQFEIGPDSLITVSLESNPSTGYYWKDVPFKPFGRSNIVVSVFPELGNQYFRSQPVMLGSGGVEVFAYGVESMGLGQIKLDLISPSGAVADTVEIGFMVVN